MSEIDGAISMLAGPIKHWWDENWDTAEHWHYAAWREAVNDGLVANQYLVYRPHEAFKGWWTERAQAVNDMALRISDVVLNLTPPGVPSLGTDGEMLYAQTHGNALILPAPPTRNFDDGVADIITRLDELNVKSATIEQETVVESFGINASRKWMVRGALEEYAGQVMRFHYEHDSGIVVADSHATELDEPQDRVQIVTLPRRISHIMFPQLQKLEVLARPVLS